MRTASCSSTGLLRISSSIVTTVSAERMTDCETRDATSVPFSRARRTTNVSGSSPGMGVSSIDAGMTVNSCPRIESNSFRRGDCEARTKFISTLFPPRFHRPRIIRPVKLQFICQRARESVEVREQGGLRDIHPVELTHSSFPDLVRRQDEFDQCLLRVRVILEDLLDRLIQDPGYEKRSGLRDQTAIHRVRFSERYELTAARKKVFAESAWKPEIDFFCLLDLDWITRPDHALSGCVVQREKRSD